MSLIKLSDAAKVMEAGQILKITGDDPIFEMGVKDYCTAHGLKLIHTIHGGDIISMYIMV